MRATVAAFEPGGGDQPVTLEPTQARVHERPRHRPDRAELTVPADDGRDRPAVPRRFDEERENAALAGRERVGRRHRDEPYSAPPWLRAPVVLRSGRSSVLRELRERGAESHDLHVTAQTCRITGPLREHAWNGNGTIFDAL